MAIDEYSLNEFNEFIDVLDNEQKALLRNYEFLRHEYGMMNPSPSAGSLEDMEAFGYPYDLKERMLPLGVGLAKKLLEQGCEVFLLFRDGSKEEAATDDDIESHVSSGGMLGVTEHDLEYEYKKSERFFVGEMFL
jgi:hypothetical protein